MKRASVIAGTVAVAAGALAEGSVDEEESQTDNGAQPSHEKKVRNLRNLISVE